MFKWGVSKELVPAEVPMALGSVSGLRRGRCDAKENEPVRPVDESIVMLTAAKAPPAVSAMIQLQLLAGMRPGEVVLMRGCDMETTGHAWTYRPLHHKTEHHGRERSSIWALERRKF